MEEIKERVCNSLEELNLEIKILRMLRENIISVNYVGPFENRHHEYRLLYSLKSEA